MDIIKLDPYSFRPTTLVDFYESMIWTERFKTAGDFKLQTSKINYTLDLLPLGSLISLVDSRELMFVEDHEITKNEEDGSETLLVSGRSFETFLEKRASGKSFNSPAGVQPWQFSFDRATSALLYVIVYIITQGGINAIDNIDQIYVSVDGSLNERTVETRQYSVTFDSLYNNMMTIANSGNVGIYNYRPDVDGKQIFMFVSAGYDRSINQSERDPVVFRAQDGHFKSTKYLFSNRDERNVAYVFSPIGTLIKPNANTNPLVSGFNRLALSVNASDITEIQTGMTKNALLSQRALQELAKHKQKVIFEGVVSSSNPYKYGVDYMIGDLVTVQGDYGVNQSMRITEYIRSENFEGEIHYPTLKSDT